MREMTKDEINTTLFDEAAVLRKRVTKLEDALRDIAEEAEAGVADRKSSCRTEAKAIAMHARQMLK